MYIQSSDIFQNYWGNPLNFCLASPVLGVYVGGFFLLVPATAPCRDCWEGGLLFIQKNLGAHRAHMSQPKIVCGETGCNIVEPISCLIPGKTFENVLP